MLMMSRREYDTHGFDRQRYRTPMQPVYLNDYRALPLTLSYADRPQMRSAPIATPVERHQLESDLDLQGSNSQSRRRIAVAVSRSSFPKVLIVSATDRCSVLVAESERSNAAEIQAMDRDAKTVERLVLKLAISSGYAEFNSYMNIIADVESRLDRSPHRLSNHEVLMALAWPSWPMLHLTNKNIRQELNIPCA
jgi:hypothetical protein